VSLIGLVVGILALFVPPLSIAGVILWASRLGQKQRASRLEVWVAYGLAALGAVVIFGGGLLGVLGMSRALDDVEPSDKARMLGQGISEAMNCGAAGVLVVFAGAVWLAVGQLVRRWR
jgi:hypothetical protein